MGGDQESGKRSLGCFASKNRDLEPVENLS
jgi:hypothetical protein